MSEREQIGVRIKELRKKFKFSQTQVAQKLFISQAAYSLVECSRNGIVVEHIVKLSDLYNVTTDFLLKGEKNLIKMTSDNGFIPYIAATAHAGFVKNFSQEMILTDYDWYRIPGHNPAIEQKLFEVEGKSMVPTILPGDVVICQVQKKINNILDGSVVLLVTSDSIIVKRIRIADSPDYFILESDNPEDVVEHKVKKSDILEAMMVRGKISSWLIPNHQVVSKGKIQELEDSLEMLKKELYSMSKKLKGRNI